MTESRKFKVQIKNNPIPLFFFVVICAMIGFGIQVFKKEPDFISYLPIREDAVSGYTVNKKALSKSLTLDLMNLLKREGSTFYLIPADVRITKNDKEEVMMALDSSRYFGFAHDWRNVSVELFSFDEQNEIVQIQVSNLMKTHYFRSDSQNLISDLKSYDEIK